MCTERLVVLLYHDLSRLRPCPVFTSYHPSQMFHSVSSGQVCPSSAQTWSFLYPSHVFFLFFLFLSLSPWGRWEEGRGGLHGPHQGPLSCPPARLGLGQRVLISMPFFFSCGCCCLFLPICFGSSAALGPVWALQPLPRGGP